MKTKTTAVFCGVLAIACAAIAASIEFKGTLKLTPTWTNIKTDGASVVIETFASIIDSAHTTGTNANQMTSLARATGTLTNGQEVSLNLLGGVSNSFGDALTFTRVNFLAITAASANLGTIHAGGAVSAAFATWTGSGTNSYLIVRPGGAVVLHAPDITGYQVATNGILKISNASTNAASYAVYVAGIE